MYATYSYFCSRVISLGCSLVTALVVTSSLLALAGDGPGEQVVTLSVDDPRPVAKMIELLEASYGWVITYEDPRYVHESDIKDVTYKVRRDLDQFEPGKAPKVLIPKGGRLNLSYGMSPEQSGPGGPAKPVNPINPAALLQTLLDIQAASGNPGVFRLERTDPILHVVPAQVKNAEGRMVPQGSILDAAITLPEQERTGVATLEAICAAVSQATRQNVVVGTIPMNPFFHHRSRQGAANETARDVLVRTLAAINSKLSWQLFYDPGLKLYALNIHMVSKPIVR